MWNIQRMPSAREATTQADDASATAQELPRLIEKTAELKSLIQALRPEYEYTAPLSFGGVPVTTKPYSLYVPFGGPCEVSVICATTFDAGDQNLVLTTESGLNVTDIAGTSITMSLDGNQRFYLPLALNGANVGTVALAPCWFPLEAQQLYLYVGGAATKSAFITLQFRRRINPAGVPNPGY